MRALFVVGFLLCAIAAVASIVSTAIPYWLYKGSSQASEYQGLWRGCIEVASVKTCSNNENVPDWWKATQAMMILGILFLALSFFLGCVQCKNESSQIFQGSVFTSVLGGVVLIIAVIIFGVKEKEVKSDFSAGFYLALVAGVLAIISAILMAVSKRGASGYSSI